jgi:hypothetical protein
VFEFHGWAVIRVPDRDDEPMDVIRGREDEAIKRVRAAIREADDEFSLFDVARASNGIIVLYAHGLRNHRYEPAIGLFRWLAAELPDAYGLLYVQDDESDAYGNEFRVWRVARGQCEELSDALLSPYIPTVEPPSGHSPRG